MNILSAGRVISFLICLLFSIEIFYGLRLAGAGFAEAFATSESAHEDLEYYTDRGATSVFALRGVLILEPDDWRTPDESALFVQKILAIRPMSTRDWLMLAYLQYYSGKQIGNVINSLSISGMTGPNEGDIMFQRSLLNMRLLDELTSELKQKAANDLIGTWDTLSSAQKEQIKRLTSVSTQSSRQDLRAFLINYQSNGEGAKIAFALALDELN